MVMDQGRRAGLVKALPPPRVIFIQQHQQHGGYQHAASSPSALETWSLPERAPAASQASAQVVGSVPAAVAAALGYLSTR